MCLVDFDNEEGEASPSTTVRTPPPPNRVMGQAFGGRRRRLGEPPFPPIFVGGTYSLAVLLVVGATIILIVSLVNYSDFRDADLSDFSSLGPEGCRIVNAVSYTLVERELNALNRECYEVREFNVSVVERNDFFISDPLSSRACQSSCDQCSGSRLQGENFYAGVDPTKRGVPIDDETFSECWTSEIPFNDLSAFYECDKNASSSAYCYKLTDPTEKLDEELDSLEVAMLGVYAGYGTAVLVFLWALWCSWRNRQVLKQDRLVMETMTQSDDMDEEDADKDDDKESLPKDDREP